MSPGYLYVLKNKSFRDYVLKIGKTTREPNRRAREIYCGATGVPEPFDVAFVCEVVDCSMAEKRVFRQLSSYRVNDSREFFHIPPNIACQVVREVCRVLNAEFGAPEPNVAIEWAESNPALAQDDEYQEHIGEVVSVPLEILSESPIGTSTLTAHQRDRIKILSAIFREVYNDIEESWLDSFSRDTNPESEIRIWEHIAKAFLKVDQVAYLDVRAKEEAYALLLARSNMSATKVLRDHRLEHFTTDAASAILAGYELPPAPIKVVYRKESVIPHKTKTIYPNRLVSAIQSAYSVRRGRIEKRD